MIPAATDEEIMQERERLTRGFMGLTQAQALSLLARIDADGVDIADLRSELAEWKARAVAASMLVPDATTCGELQVLRDLCLVAIKKFKPCTTCKGRGFEESPPFREWQDENTPVLSTIKIQCRRCKGTKVEPA